MTGSMVKRVATITSAVPMSTPTAVMGLVGFSSSDVDAHTPFAQFPADGVPESIPRALVQRVQVAGQSVAGAGPITGDQQLAAITSPAPP